MEGLEFYIYLQTVLTEGDFVSPNNNYRFIKWMDRSKHLGGLQFFINERNCKTIPADMIIRAYGDFNIGVPIDQDWVANNEQNNWCFPQVLKHIFLL